MLKVKVNGRFDVIKTIIANASPRVPKAKRESLRTIINRTKRAERDARIVRIITR